MPEVKEIYDDVIKKSHENVNALSQKLKDLDKLHQDINDLIKKNEELPIIFGEKFQSIIQLSQSYTETLGISTKTFLDGNNTLFTSKISELTGKIKEIEKEISRLISTDFISLFDNLQKDFITKTSNDLAIELEKFDKQAKNLQSKIDNLNAEVNRLVNTDFVKLFDNLQKNFIEKTRADLEIELKKFDEKSIDFQLKINELKKEVVRIENIDFEKHFDKLQKTLSDIFNAVNSINLSLTTVIQTLNSIVQTTGNIQIKIESNHNETKQLIKEQNEEIGKQFKEQNIEIKNIKDLFETKTKLLEEQNDRIKKDIKTNQIIMIAGFVVLFLALIYSIIKH